MFAGPELGQWIGQDGEAGPDCQCRQRLRESGAIKGSGDEQRAEAGHRPGDLLDGGWVEFETARHIVWGRRRVWLFLDVARHDYRSERISEREIQVHRTRR